MANASAILKSALLAKAYKGLRDNGTGYGYVKQLEQGHSCATTVTGRFELKPLNKPTASFNASRKIKTGVFRMYKILAAKPVAYRSDNLRSTRWGS